MKYVMCCSRDTAIDAFMPPFCVTHVGQAVRSFGDQINNQEAGNQLYLHADDYELYELGSFDDSTGRVEQLESPRLVARGKDLKKQ